MIWSDPALLRLSVLPLPPAVLLPPAQLHRLHGGFRPGSRSRGTETVGRAPDPARSFSRTPVRRYSRVLPGRALQPGDEGMALVRPRPRWCRGGASHGGPIEARVCRATPDTQLSGPRRKLILMRRWMRPAVLRLRPARRRGSTGFTLPLTGAAESAPDATVPPPTLDPALVT
jgi:hypothetical protein